MERIKRSLKGRYWRKVITYFLTCCLFLNTSLPAVMAGPAGGVVDTTNGGAAEILYEQGINEHTTQVNVATTRTIINWDSLNTAGGDAEARETLAFSQGGLTGSAVLNRISGDITHFGGDLSAPGMRIFMVNPAGIMFDGGSTVNVTQLVASGLGMTNDAFHAVLDDPVNNKMEFLTGEGEVVSRAIITADSVYLIGKKVYNIGPIIAKNGLVVMAAGDEVRLFEDGSDVSVVVNSEGDGFDNPDIRNSGRVDVPNGKIVLAAGDTFSRAISIHGIVTAQGGTVTAKAALVEHIGKIDVSAYPSGADGDGGSISLTGTERVVIGPEGTPGEMFANAGANGNGGDITIQTGKLTINETSSITATGGSVSGDGGSVTITCDDFEIAGDIYASPGNKINEPGKLEINTPSVIIADGANAGETDTLYEDDIENLSLAGTSLVVNAEEGITVKDIDDNEITGKFGDIKLLADMENPDSFVSFEESSNTIRTSLGDIVIEAGGGGIDVGNLITGKDLADEKPAPGQIFLTTGSEGDITTGDLIIESGWRHAEINVKSDSDLTVNGDVRVGMNEDGVKSSILNVPPDASAEAMIYLKAADNVVLEGDVYADAHGKDEAEDQTKAYIEIIAGGDVEINDDLYAEAKSSNNGTADAVITVKAVGDIVFVDGAKAYAIADQTEVQGTVSDEKPIDYDPADGVDHAQIIIDDSAIVLEDDNFSTAKSAIDVVLDVLDNDTLEGEATVDSAEIDPAAGSAGSLTIDLVGDKTVLIYNPPEDLINSDIKFDENGEATVTFTYTVEDNTATGTITLINGLPVAVDDLATAFKDQANNISVLTNDTDPDTDPLKPVLGDITPKNGTLVLNEDGTFTYTPDEGFVGTDTFKYSATDGFNTSSEVEVKITVSEKPPTPITPALTYIQPAPGLERIEIEISGCPALVKWAAEEIGIDQRLVQIWVANSLASTGNIQPCDACEGLKNAAKILQDADGTHIAALTQVINEFASSTAPPTEEQMASIADAITRNTDADSYYATADEYLDALVTYVGILSSEMGFSTIESVQLVTDKYIGRLAQGQNVGVASFIAASLAALGG